MDDDGEGMFLRVGDLLFEEGDLLVLVLAVPVVVESDLADAEDLAIPSGGDAARRHGIEKLDLVVAELRFRMDAERIPDIVVSAREGFAPLHVDFFGGDLNGELHARALHLGEKELLSVSGASDTGIEMRMCIDECQCHGAVPNELGTQCPRSGGGQEYLRSLI